jgi:hypothetical protein
MLGDPPVLMFDEPFNGMDPEGTREMRGFLRSLAARGRAVLVSGHLMSELEDTADHLVVVGRGTVIADTSMAALIARASGGRVVLRTTAAEEAKTVLESAGAAVAAAAGPGVITATGLAAEAIIRILSDNGVPFSEVSAHRASVLALALALGAMLRRSAVAVTIAIAGMVVTYVLGVAQVLPAGASEWLLRVTPAAAFAVQQSIPAYPQVNDQYTPPAYFPLAPWAGFAVLCGYAALALGLATYLLRRRDA